MSRLALTKKQAADQLGVSIDTLERIVMPEVRIIRRGRVVLIPQRELEKWVEQNAARPLAS